MAEDNSLYAAKIPSAYAAKWQYQNRAVSGVAIPVSLVTYDDDGFDMVYDFGNFSAQANNEDNYFAIYTGPILLEAGNGIRVKGVFQFTPSPILSGNVQLIVTTTVDPTTPVSPIYTADSNGTIDFTYIATVDDSYQVTVLGGSSSGASWNLGDMVQGAISVENFPPSLAPVEYALNPSIPWHRVVLAIPDQSFACVCNLKFLLGGTEQSVLEIPLGPVSGRFYATPPTKDIQSLFWKPDNVNPFLLKDQKLIDNEDTGTVSLYCAAFEWSSVADSLRVEFTNFVGNPSSVFVGAMQYPLV